MRSLVAFALIVSAAASAIAQPPPETWRFNPRERTAAGLAELEKGDADAALDRFETANRLDEGNPITLFNAATAQLLAGKEEAAEMLLETVALAPPELQSAANYNLGNARLAQGDPATAIEAYKQALRVEPGHEDAKFNLEIAQRLLEKKKKEEEEQKQEQEQQGDQEQKQEEQSSPEDESEEEEQQEEQSPAAEESPPDPSQGEPQAPQPEPDGSDLEQDRPLPDFEDQQDMTAEQAAAILEAVENLEREQRRQQALERAKKRARSGKDW